MADQATLQAEKRTVMGKAVKKLRREGILPANIGGHRAEPLAIQVKLVDLERLMKAQGPTALFRIVIPGGIEQAALIGRVQRHPVSREIEHVDFVHVEMNQPIRVRVPIHVEGEPPAVKAGEGMLLHLLNEIEVEALPADLPKALVVDVSGLAAVDDAVYVRDLQLPARVKLTHTQPDETVAKVAVTRAAIEEAATEAAAEAPAAGEAAEAGTPAAQE